MQENWELPSIVLRLDLPQHCVSIGYRPAMYYGRVYHNNVLMLGIAQKCSKATCTPAKENDSVHSP